MKRVLCCLVAVVAACQKPSPSQAPSARKLSEPPPPPDIGAPPAKGDGEESDFRIAAARPQGKLLGGVHPTITFSEPVALLSTLEQGKDPATGKLQLLPAVKGRWHWLGSSSVEFLNDEPFPYSTAFHLVVPQGFPALDGKKLEKPYQLDFTTPTVEVSRYDVSPSESQCKWSLPDQRFSIVVNQPIAEPEKFFFYEVGEQKERVAARVDKTVSVREEQRDRKPERQRFEWGALGFRDERTRYEIVPVKTMPRATHFAVGLDGEARGTAGPLTAGQEFRFSCDSLGPMRVETVRACGQNAGDERHCPGGPLQLTFSNPIASIAEVKARVHVTPDPQPEWDESTDTFQTSVVLPGKFRPGQRYAVHIDAGVKDALGQESPAFDGAITTDDLRPSLYVGQEKALLEAGGDGQLPAQVTNVSALEVDLWKVEPLEMAQHELCSGKGCNPLPPSPPDASLRLPLTYPKNEPHLHGIDLRAALQGKKLGLVIARIKAPGTDFADHPLRVLAQITDLAVHAKLGAKSGLAWVTSVSQGMAMPGAAVRVYDRTGKQVASATADSHGLAVLPGYQELDPQVESWSGPRMLVAASFGDDVGYVTTEGYDELVPPEVNRSFRMDRQGLGVIFTDRGIYRPGDTAHIKAIVRVQEGGELSTPAGTTVHVSVRDVDDKALLDKDVALSRFGTLSVDVPIGKDVKLGAFSAAVSLLKPQLLFASGSFRVAEYRAPQFRVDVVTQKSEAIAGEELTANVVARYLFGGAMDRAQVSWSAVRTSEEFTPPRNDAFHFGRQAWSWDDGSVARDSSQFGSGQGEIDATGTLAVKAGKAEAMADRPARYTIEAEVADVSRQRVAGRNSVLVHPASIYVGFGRTDLFARVGEATRLPIVAVKPDGTRVPASVHVAVQQRSWRLVRKKGMNGIFQSVSEAVEENVAQCDVKTEGEPKDCTFKLEQPGYFLVRAEAKDETGHLAVSTTSLYATGKGVATWQQNDTQRVDIVPDKTEYQPGETAHLLVKSPFADCDALVSTEREGVGDQRVLHLSGRAALIDVPVTEAMVPNMYVGLLLVRPRVAVDGDERGDDPGRPAMRMGYAELSVGLGVKRLSVAIATPRAEYKPRETVPIDIVVTDAANKPVAGEVQLYVVDEAVLRLTAYKLPDPLEAMFPRHPLMTSIGEPLARLVRKQKFGEKGEVQPGGGGGLEASGDVRNKFVSTVDWRTLTTGRDGKAHADVLLPDNLTSFRIMAVATTEADRFGGGETLIRVALPLLVLPALPRFARVGDEFEAGVVVHSLQATEVAVSAQVAGGVELAGPAEMKASIEAGVAREVRFRLRAMRQGPATLRFRATAGALTDAVEQTIPVSLPVELEAVAVAGDTDSKRDEGLVPPKDVRADTGGLELQLSSTALGGLEEGMRQLIDYPYGCVEQLSSRLVPFVALREISRVFGVEPPDVVKDPEEVVRTTVHKLEQLQTPSGGFLYWPSATCPYAWPSIYATLALHRARELGYPVKRETLDLARRFLAEKAAGKASCDHETIEPSTRAFALQVLARMGDPRPSYYDQLYVEKDKLPLFGKALLADAMAIGKGKRARALALLQDVLDSARETTREVHFEENNAVSYAPLLSSDTRTTGMVLQTLVDLQPAHPFVSKIARYLSGVRRGGEYRNTQEAAYALMGLAEVVRAKERATPDFVARVKLGDKDVATQPFKGRSLAVTAQSVPMKDLLSRKSVLPLSFQVDGTGNLYYTALLRYAPEKLPDDARNEGIFVQRWFEPYESPGRLATDFAAGDLARVQVRVATSQERNFVAIEVPLPAGLEAVDTSLATTKQETRAGDDGEETTSVDESEGYANAFWSPFNYSEKRDDRVVYFADHLPPGVHTLSFIARATTPGKFILKPAHAGEMYAPEVFGRSEGGTFSIVAARPLAQK